MLLLAVVFTVLTFVLPSLSVPLEAQARATPALRNTLIQLLSAMEDNDMGQIRSVSTKQGYQFMVRALNNHREAGKILRTIGTREAASRVRWIKVTETFARGRVKFVLIDFITQGGKWKFNGATVE